MRNENLCGKMSDQRGNPKDGCQRWFHVFVALLGHSQTIKTLGKKIGQKK